MVRFEESVREYPARRMTHRHAFHEIMIFRSGAGMLHADFAQHSVHGPALVVIPSGVVHQWPDHESLRGMVLGFDLGFLGQSAICSEVSGVVRSSRGTVISLDAEGWGTVQPWVDSLHDEWCGEKAGRLEMLRCGLASLLIEVSRIQAQNDTSAPPTAADLLYQEFSAELERQIATMPSPASLAKALRVSTDHLSATLRTVTSHSAGVLITERTALEAKRLLIHSRLTISEAAFALGFESASYFSRFFRKHVGTTPGEFRDGQL